MKLKANLQRIARLAFIFFFGNVIGQIIALSPSSTETKIGLFLSFLLFTISVWIDGREHGIGSVKELRNEEGDKS